MLLEILIDLLMPTRGSKAVARPDRDGKTLRVEMHVPDAFKHSLNESGWIDDEAITAGVLRQGRQHSVLGLLFGLGLFELARPRRSKSLPREFVLAVTRDRVVAFALSLLSEGTETTTTAVRIKRGVRGSWPRELVRIVDRSKNLLESGATLEVAGERIPVVWEGDAWGTGELVELLSS